jgi:hypothetical protein
MRSNSAGRAASLMATCALTVVACGAGERIADAHTQASAPQAGRSAHEPRNDNAAHPAMNVTGCIERGVIPGSFMLTHVTVAGTDAGAGKRADAHTAPAQTYTLRSLERGTDLGSFVGKRVVVVGRLTADRDQTGLGTRGTTGDDANRPAGKDKVRSDRPGGTQAAGPTAEAANVRQLDADSIRAVAGTCTPAEGRR